MKDFAESVDTVIHLKIWWLTWMTIMVLTTRFVVGAGFQNQFAIARRKGGDAVMG